MFCNKCSYKKKEYITISKSCVNQYNLVIQNLKNKKVKKCSATKAKIKLLKYLSKELSMHPKLILDNIINTLN